MPRGSKARTLNDEVREALLTILKDAKAPASARASAGRTLAEFYGDSRADGRKAPHSMTAAEIDAEIADLDSKPKEAAK